MFQNAAVDVAISLAVMYLLLSLTCTVINEYIASKLDLRSKSLGVGLKALLDVENVRAAFYQHGLIAGTRTALTRASNLSVVRSATIDPPAAAASTSSESAAPAGAAASVSRAAPSVAAPPVTHPSYFSTNTFVLALLGSLTSGEETADGLSIPTFADLEKAVLKLPHSHLRDALVTNLIVAQGDFERFRKGVASWFDDSMDRLSGAYRRHLKLISIAVGCLLAIALNADTFAVSRVLWSDGALRAQMAGVAESTVKAGLSTDSTAGPTPNTPTAAEIEDRITQVNRTLRPLPIGWSLQANASFGELKRNIESKPLSYWPVKLLGLFATGLALSFGAPFWFDALSKFMNIRAAGVKPARQT
jgi:hypothetical protein